MDTQKSNQKRRIGNSARCHELLKLELVEIPKVLCDVFEAIIGAVYIDSGHNLEFLKLIKIPVFSFLMFLGAKALYKSLV